MAQVRFPWDIACYCLLKKLQSTCSVRHTPRVAGLFFQRRVIVRKVTGILSDFPYETQPDSLGLAYFPFVIGMS